MADLTLEFKAAEYGGHFQEEGNNGIEARDPVLPGPSPSQLASPCGSCVMVCLLACMQ